MSYPHNTLLKKKKHAILKVMESIKESIKEKMDKTYTVGNQKSNERAELIKPFVERVNRSREEAGYKPYTPAVFGIRMSHIKTEDLHQFYKDLSKGRNFTALWEWYTNPKNN
jgi:hypothetical protein